MLFMRKPSNSASRSRFPPVPDPWEMPPDEPERQVCLAMPYLDVSHELTGFPNPLAIMPEGRPGVFNLPEHAQSDVSAMAILLKDEIKLARQIDDPLRNSVRDAIAFLMLVNSEPAAVD